MGKQDEETFVPQSSSKPLSDLFRLIKEQPEATIIQYAQVIGVTERMIKKHLKTLKEIGAIRRIGSNRRGYWEVMLTSEF